MSKNKKIEIIDKSNIMKCWTCNGEGSIIINEAHPLVREQCKVCDGKGNYKESHFIIIDHKNKIAIDSDTNS